MSRGRPPKHPELKRLAGNPGKRAMLDCPVDMQGAPFVPEHLPDDAADVFDVVLNSLPARTYASCDTFILSAFAMAWAIHKRASIALQGQPLVVMGSKGTPIQNPLLAIVNAQAKIMASIGSRLFLDPVSRAGLQPRSDRPSKFAGLIGQSPDYHRKFSN